MRLQAAGYESFLHLLGLLAEAGVTDVRHHGANEVSVADDFEVTDEELRAEIAGTLRPGSVPPGWGPSVPSGGEEGRPAPAAAAERGAPSEGARPPARPPRSGPGSGRSAWVEAAEARGLTVTEQMSRDEIAERVEAHDHGS